MGYCTQADLETRYGSREIQQLTDRERTGEIDSAVVNQAIADASAMVDGFLEDGGYNVPLSPTPTVIRHHCCQIARYLLYEDHATPTVEDNYQASMMYLQRVAEGKSKLGESTGVTQGEAIGNTAAPTITRIFDDDLWDDYMQ